MGIQVSFSTFCLQKLSLLYAPLLCVPTQWVCVPPQWFCVRWGGRKPLRNMGSGSGFPSVFWFPLNPDSGYVCPHNGCFYFGRETPAKLGPWKRFFSSILISVNPHSGYVCPPLTVAVCVLGGKPLWIRDFTHFKKFTIPRRVNRSTQFHKFHNSQAKVIFTRFHTFHQFHNSQVEGIDAPDFTNLTDSQFPCGVDLFARFHKFHQFHNSQVVGTDSLDFTNLTNFTFPGRWGQTLRNRRINLKENIYDMRGYMSRQRPRGVYKE